MEKPNPQQSLATPAEYVSFLEKRLTPTEEETFLSRLWRVLQVLIPLMRFGRSRDLLGVALSSAEPKAYLRGTLRSILDALPTEARERIQEIPMACIPRLRSANAEAALTPKGEPYIVFDTGLLSCLNAMTKAIAHRMAFQGDSPKRQVQSRETVLSWLRLAVEALDTGDVDALTRIPLPPEKSIAIIKAELVHGLIVFVLSHELAHHTLGHKGSARQTEICKSPQTSIVLLSRTQEQELAADLIGAQFTYFTLAQCFDEDWALSRNMPVTRHPMFLAAPDIFLTLLSVWEKLLGSGRSHSDTHPPADLRRATIRKHHDNEVTLHALEFGQQVERLVDDILTCM